MINLHTTHSSYETDVFEQDMRRQHTWQAIALSVVLLVSTFLYFAIF